MIINNIHITSFGQLSDFDAELSTGLNVISGNNEAGKTTVWAFVKFIFYGLTRQERERFIPWGKDSCSGYLTLTFRKKTYRIERRCLISSTKDKVSVYDENNAKIDDSRPVADIFLGVPENVFVNTAFTPQLGGTAVNGQSMPEAIENIIFSADETVNTRKAMKTLDDARVLLYHKNKRGGKIYELENLIAELEISFENVKKSAARILELEDKIRSDTAKRNANKERCGLISAQLDEFDAFTDLDIVAKYKNTCQVLEKLREKAKALEDSYCVNGFLPDCDYLSGLKLLESEAAELNMKLSEADKKLSAAENNLLTCSDSQLYKKISNLGGTDKIADIVKMSKTHIARNRFRCTAFWIISLIPLFGGIAFATIYEEYIAAGICGGVFLILLVLSIIFSSNASKIKHKLNLFYAKLGVDSAEELDGLFSNVQSAEEQRQSAQEAEDKCREVCDSLRAELSALESHTTGFTCVYKNTDIKGLSAHIDSVEEILQKLSEANAEVEKQEYAVHLNEEKASKIDVELTKKRLHGKLKPQDAADFDTAGKRMELNMLTRANEALTERINENERELAAAKATQTTSPSAVADRLNVSRSQLQTAKEEYAAYILASEALTCASKDLRESVIPRLCKISGEYISSFTGGKYDSLGVAHDLSMTYTADSSTHPAESLSGGTLDAAYISLRIALCDILYLKSPCPLFFDDSFAHSDDIRLARIMSTLHGISSDRQIVVFTCHKRESFAASRLGDRVIEMPSDIQ